MVLGLCRLLLRDPIEAEDAAQQVFLSAHQALLRGSAPRDPAAWTAAIARNECRARIRARMREPLALPEVPSDLPDPLASAIRAADLHAVWSALGTLPRRQRRALVLRELGGLSYHELGRTLGVSHSAVESLLFRARQRIRSLVAGTNAAAVPLALRDELARLIPGFDPGTTSASRGSPHFRLPGRSRARPSVSASSPPAQVNCTPVPPTLRFAVKRRRRWCDPTRPSPRWHAREGSNRF
jgi:RNA polymerase sigma factor (sigma-70 family)